MQGGPLANRGHYWLPDGHQARPLGVYYYADISPALRSAAGTISRLGSTQVCRPIFAILAALS
jgi:hypothetical protein